MVSRKKLTRITLGILLTLALLTVLGGVSAQGGTHPGGRLVVADGASNTSLDPFVTSWHSWPHYAIYATLFMQDANLNYVGFLADTWEVGADGKSLTIHLIKDATFTDGTPVDAEAIKWNLDKYSNPDTGASQGADLVGLLEETTVDDPYTVTLHLNSPYAPLFHTLWGLEIVSPTAYEAEGKENFGTHPVGCGSLHAGRTQHQQLHPAQAQSRLPLGAAGTLRRPRSGQARRDANPLPRRRPDDPLRAGDGRSHGCRYPDAEPRRY